MKLKIWFAICVSSLLTFGQNPKAETDSLKVQIKREQKNIDSAMRQIDTLQQDWDYIKKKIEDYNANNQTKKPK
jgi:septal ring factor EnvC (AmiA/AmiB activator)